MSAWTSSTRVWKDLFKEGTADDGTMALANIKSVEDPKAEIERLRTEQNDLGKESQGLESIVRAQRETEETREHIEEVKNSLNAPAGNRPNLNAGGDDDDDPVKAFFGPNPVRSLGYQYVQSQEWKETRKLEGKGNADHVLSTNHSLKALMYGAMLEDMKSTKALFDNSDFDPFEAQVPDIVQLAWGGPRQFLGMIPQVPIMTDSGRYHALTTRTQPGTNAYSVAEGAVYPEWTIEYDDRTFSVVARGSFVPVSTWAEEDSPQVMDDINRQLITGTARNIAGFAITTMSAATGTTTRTAGADSPTSAIYKIITDLRTDADVEPNLIVMHPDELGRNRH